MFWQIRRKEPKRGWIRRRVPVEGLTEDVVPEMQARCPYCLSTRRKNYGKRSRWDGSVWRYYRCLSCKGSFRSVEVEPEADDDDLADS